MTDWLKSFDRNEVTYWVGLVMMFIGLTLGVSIETALVVTGSAMALESVITSYLATWLSLKSARK
ncbi:MAG: hypothetical protein RBT75_16580 [Anaerolineae bacterium]|jgi:hypothetical protein|nr:hypothetical protein [Anaerolineae bacterium]